MHKFGNCTLYHTAKNIEEALKIMEDFRTFETLTQFSLSQWRKKKSHFIRFPVSVKKISLLEKNLIAFFFKEKKSIQFLFAV